MALRFYYVDESYDNRKFCLSAISIRHSDWNECFDLVVGRRRELKERYGLYLRKEVHAMTLLGGRGKIANRTVGKHERYLIYRSLLDILAKLPNVFVINVALDCPNHRDVQLLAWDRQLNRIERTIRAFEERGARDRRALTRELENKLDDHDFRNLTTLLDAFCPRAIVIADEGR